MQAQSGGSAERLGLEGLLPQHRPRAVVHPDGELAGGVVVPARGEIGPPCTRAVKSARLSVHGPRTTRRRPPLLSRTIIRPGSAVRDHSTAEPVVTSPLRAPSVRSVRFGTSHGPRASMAAAGTATADMPPAMVARRAARSSPSLDRSSQSNATSPHAIGGGRRRAMRPTKAR